MNLQLSRQYQIDNMDKIYPLYKKIAENTYDNVLDLYKRGAAAVCVIAHLSDTFGRGDGPGPGDEKSISFGAIQDRLVKQNHTICPEINWPSLSGPGIKSPVLPIRANLGVNFFDSSLPVYNKGICQQAVRDAFRDVEGHDLEPIKERHAEIICEVSRDDNPVPGAHVYLVPLQGQPVNAWGVKADNEGKAWFAIPHGGKYRLECALADGSISSKEMKIKSPVPISETPGFEHIERIKLNEWKGNK